MSYTYPYFKLPNKTVFNALDKSAFQDIVVVGETEGVAGYHVNTSLKGEIPTAWLPYHIEPVTPNVEWFNAC